MQKKVEVYFYARIKPRQSANTREPGDPTVWRRIQRVMKITSAIILIAALHVSAVGTAQKISFSGENVPLTKVFNAIEDQLGFGVLMPHKLLEDAKPVTVKIQGGTLDELLQKCFEFQPWRLSYTVTGHTIYISEVKPSLDQPKDLPPVKKVKVSGTVYNESGEPLSGANVIIKELQKGTSTNARGEFDLGAIAVNSTVTISFIGYAPQQIKIKDDVNVKIYLKTASNELDKAVVQAYGNTTARLNTGNISTVSAAEIERQPVMNPLTALEGKVPGMVVQQTNGYASAPFKIEIRGRSVIDPSRPSEPLYIIDGVPLTVLESGFGGNYADGSPGLTQNGFTGPAGGQSPMFSINPSDIESISVLKDADATAIYGSRGANGVILITTKKGRPGKTKMDVSAYQGISAVTNHYSMLNTQQYLVMREEAFKNDGISPNPGNAYDLLTWDTTRNTDWQKYLWGRLAQSTDLELSLSGGDKQTTFRLAGGYHRETDITEARGSNQRASVQFNLSHRSLNDRLSLSFTSTYSYINVNIIPLPGSVAYAPDAAPAFLSPGNIDWADWYPSSNPFGSLLQFYTANTGFLNSALNLQYQIVKGLDFSTKLGYSTSHNSQLQEIPISSQDPINNPTGSSNFGNNNNQNAIVEPQLEYKGLIAKGKLDFLAGASTQSVSQNGNVIQGSGYLNDHLLGSIDNAPTTSSSDNNDSYKYAAVFGRINYNWEDKYLINLSARRDGSSRFGPGKQYGNFGAIGAAWIFTEEDWFKRHFSSLSFGKLRGSYGLTGSDAIGDYSFLSRWASISLSTYIAGTPSYLPQGLFNPDLEWQVNKKLEGALDLGFLKDRLALELAFYQNRCGNQLVSSPLPYITGFNNVTENLPATIQNMGFESTVHAKIIDQKSFELIANFDIGVNRNKLIAFPNLSQSPYASVYEIGKPLNIAHLLHYTGIDPQTGQYTFYDKNHDGQIDTDPSDSTNDLYPTDLTIKSEGGFGFDMRYRRLQISAFFRFRQWVEVGNIAGIGIPGNPNNEPTDVLNRWQKPGDKAQFARFTTQPQVSDENFYFYSDGVYSNGNYIRLQNLAFSYDLKIKGLNACKLYLRGENLLLITKYKGLDPDVPYFSGMPPAKTFVGGLLFTF